MEAWATLIFAAATLITAIGALAMGIKNSNKLNDVHISLDGRLSELLQSHGAEMKAEGVQQERDRVEK